MTVAAPAPGVAAATLAGGRATRALVDLDAYEGNVRTLLSRLTPGTALMAVVKANAYGHGAAPIARAAIAGGATRLGVATVGEGERLRRAGIEAPILILGPIEPDEAAAAVRLGLDVTVATEALLDAVATAARGPEADRRPGVHVKLDSGMRRYGAEPGLALALARRIAADPAVRLAGVSTHFAAADEADEGFTREQAARFERCLADLAAVGVRPALAHAANSAAALRSRRYHYGMVRAGIALYGLAPSDEVGLAPGMGPVLSLRSRVARVTELAPGETVGYGRTYRAEGGERAALVPIGYADGYARALSGRGWMGIGGRRAPVLGRVSMDQTVVAVPAGEKTEVGAEVVVVGAPEEGAPTVGDVARLTGTIPYEVVTGLAARVDRHFLRGGRVVAVERLAQVGVG